MISIPFSALLMHNFRLLATFDPPFSLHLSGRCLVNRNNFLSMPLREKGKLVFHFSNRRRILDLRGVTEDENEKHIVERIPIIGNVNHAFLL